MREGLSSHFALCPSHFPVNVPMLGGQDIQCPLRRQSGFGPRRILFILSEGTQQAYGGSARHTGFGVK